MWNMESNQRLLAVGAKENISVGEAAMDHISYELKEVQLIMNSWCRGLDVHQWLSTVSTKALILGHFSYFLWMLLHRKIGFMLPGLLRYLYIEAYFKKTHDTVQQSLSFRIWRQTIPQIELDNVTDSG